MPDEDLFAATLAAAHARGLSFSDRTPPDDRFFAVNGLRLHYLDWGTEGKPPMILLHGFAVTAHAWDFFSLAARAEYHIYALEHRGHGDSDWAPDGDYRRERHVDDLVAVLDALRLPSVVLAGHSLGGSVALAAATRMPERVRALVMVDSSLSSHHRLGTVGRFVQGPDRFPSLEAFAEYAASLNPRRSTDGVLRSLRYNARQFPDGQWTWKYDRLLRSPDRPRGLPDFPAMWSALATLPCPILYVRAGEASHLTQECIPRLEALAPRVRLVTLPRASHSVMSGNPVAFAREVKSFLRDVTAP